MRGTHSAKALQAEPLHDLSQFVSMDGSINPGMGQPSSLGQRVPQYWPTFITYPALQGVSRRRKCTFENRVAKPEIRGSNATCFSHINKEHLLPKTNNSSLHGHRQSHGRESVCGPEWSGHVLFFHANWPSTPEGNVTVAVQWSPSNRYEVSIMPSGCGIETVR